MPNSEQVMGNSAHTRYARVRRADAYDAYLNESRPLDASSLRLALFTDTYSPQVNGVARTLERLRDAVEARGGVVRVFTISDPESAVESHVERFSSVPFWAYRQLRLAWPSTNVVRQQLHRFRPTVVHVATPFGIGLAGRRLAREFDVPLVTSYHTSFAAYASYYGVGAAAGWLWRFLRWFHNAGLRTYCPTRAIVDEVAAHGFLNTAVWSRGVDTTRFSPAYRSSSLRASMGADDSTLVVTYVGRLAAEKGLAVAVNAVRIAASLRPGKVVFACVGDGPYEAEVQRSAPEGTWLPGKMLGQKLSEAYASGDVFMFPSATDTFGNVLLEAMASGLPVVGADVGPTRELVGADRGWLVPAGDAEAFAQVLVNLVDNPAARIRARDQAIAFAQASTWDRVWDGLVGDYLLLQRR
jgi:glycosyltransferase involved in cell wall biosynthesis